MDEERLGGSLGLALLFPGLPCLSERALDQLSLAPLIASWILS